MIEARAQDPQAITMAAGTSYFTVFVGGETFGLPVANTQTIFRITSVTPIPLGPKDIVGLVNLRGRIVTAVCLRRRLRMPPNAATENPLAIGIEHRGENFALIVDQVGDVLSLNESMKIKTPSHFNAERTRLTTSLYRVGDLLIPVLDVEAVFDLSK